MENELVDSIKELNEKIDKLNEKKEFLLKVKNLYKKFLEDESLLNIDELNKKQEESQMILSLILKQRKILEANPIIMIEQRQKLDNIKYEMNEKLEDQELLLDYLSYEFEKEVLKKYEKKIGIKMSTKKSKLN